MLSCKIQTANFISRLDLEVIDLSNYLSICQNLIVRDWTKTSQVFM